MNVFQFAAVTEKNWEMNLADMSGYQRKYTFYSDFSIADFCQCRMGERDAIKKTFNNVINSWGKSIEAMTEIVLVLNHKCWSYYKNVDGSYIGLSKEKAMELSKIYHDLYYKADSFVREHFKDDDKAMRYYFEVTD